MAKKSYIEGDSIETMIVDAISLRLKELYPEIKYRYDHFTDQDLHTPCFIITYFSGNSRPRIGLSRFNEDAEAIRGIDSLNFHIEFHGDTDESGRVNTRQIREIAGDVLRRLDMVKLKDGSYVRFYDSYAYPYLKYALLTFRTRVSTVEYLDGKQSMRSLDWNQRVNEYKKK